MIRKLIGPEYPKTSCECSECPQTNNLPLWPARGAKEGDINNLGLSSCSQVGEISSCGPISYVRSTKGPNPWTKNPYTILNPNFGLEQAPGFSKQTQIATAVATTGVTASAQKIKE